MIKFDYNI